MPGARRRVCRRRDAAIAPQHVEGTELVLEMLAKAMELGHLKDWAI